MEAAEIIKAYTELGVLGLCAVMMIIMFWQNFKRSHKKDDYKDEKIDKKDSEIAKLTDSINDKFAKMLDLLQKQNDEYRINQQKQIEEENARNQQIIDKVINGVITHTPSAEETRRLTELNETINATLEEMLYETKASRVALVQYHNGGKGVNKQSFLKMSMTNEQVATGVKPFMPDFKDQFRSVLAYFVKELNLRGFCYIDDIETLSSVDTSMYEFMKNKGVQAKYGCSIVDSSDCVIGFICVEYINKSDADRAVIENCFREHHKIFDALLNS